MFALARRNGIGLPYPSVDALRDAYRFGNLQDFSTSTTKGCPY